MYVYSYVCTQTDPFQVKALENILCGPNKGNVKKNTFNIYTIWYLFRIHGMQITVSARQKGQAKRKTNLTALESHQCPGFICKFSVFVYILFSFLFLARALLLYKPIVVK